MGNTQYSLLAGNTQQFGKKERIKSSSPFAVQRNSSANQQLRGNIQIQASEPRYTQGNIKQSEFQTVSASLRSKPKNPAQQVLPSAGSPGVQNSASKITNKIRSDTNYQAKSIAQQRDNEFYIKKEGGQDLFPNSTKPDQKRFTFDGNELAKNRSEEKKTAKSAVHIEDEESQCDIFIKVYFNSTESVNVAWNSEHKVLSIGWLISEILRQLAKEETFNKRTQIVGLKNMNTKGSECYDYLLTQLDSDLSFIKNGDRLQIIKCPDKFNFVGSVVSSNFSPSSSDHVMSSNGSNLTLNDFELIKVIGKGGFSKVFQVRKKDTGKIYAMKTLSKTKIKRDNKVENILIERQILEQVSHPFIVKMKYAFQNEDYLFLLIEFCAGGELFYKLNNIPSGRMNESQAKFYFAEILEAIQYLHDNNILYRDLKPENIVIDEKGHVKITDFGLSKMDFKMNDRAYSFCGSPEYMAPEMLITDKNRHEGRPPMYHNKCLDFYHLGALLFEILCGLPPFFSEDRQMMYQDILLQQIQIPTNLTNECKDLLKQLLQKNPANRIGSKRGAQEIKEHPWCNGINWSDILSKKIEPPFKPSVEQSNFDIEYTSMDLVLQDDEQLESLGEIDLEDSYQNKKMKQKFNRNNGDQIIRQPSIELYSRENHTFRGYSFLHERGGAGNIMSPGDQQQKNQYDTQAFIFCLPESKEQSFLALGTPIHELEMHMEKSNDSTNQQENESLMKIFGTQSKLNQSQLSLLSEGINQIDNTNETLYQKEPAPVQVMIDQQFVGKEGNMILQHQQSKESLYNELISTFDYSISKKDKHNDYAKKANQTNSTMSLFSNSNPQTIGIQQNKIFANKHKLKQQESKQQTKESKAMFNQSHQKLEFNKNHRKYSPEVDLNRALLQVQQRKPQVVVKNPITMSNQKLQSNGGTSRYDNSQQSRPISNLRSSKLENHKPNKKDVSVIINTNDYMSVGSKFSKGPTTTKNIDSKKPSDVKTTIKSVANSEKSSTMRGSIYKTPNGFAQSGNTKLTTNKIMGGKNETPKGEFNLNTKFGFNAGPGQLTTLKTSLLYNNVKNKMTLKKSRNAGGNSFQNGVTNDEECKIDKSYQNLQNFNSIKYEGHEDNDNQERFVVNKIDPAELIGSFLTLNSSNRSSIDEFSTVQNPRITNGGGAAGYNVSNLNEEQKEAMTAVLLNQSHESCCCSDDEFNTRSLVAGVHQKSAKNLRKLQYNALQESIYANQSKHKANDIMFKKDLLEIKVDELDPNNKYQQSEEDTLKSFSEVIDSKYYKIGSGSSSSVKNSKFQQKNFNVSMIGLPNIKMGEQTNSNQKCSEIQLLKPNKLNSIAPRLVSPQAFHSQSLHTTQSKILPISPMRGQNGGSANGGGGGSNSTLKERPIIRKTTYLTNNASHLAQQPVSSRHSDSKLQLQNRFAQTVDKLAKKY